MNIAATGNVGIGTTSPATTALLDITSTTQGFLPPRMTTTQMNAIASPATGLTVFNTTDAAIEYYDGTAWWEAGGAAAAGTTGQIQFNTAGDFNADSNLFWDNTNKRLGIGTSSPQYALDVGGSEVIRTGGGISFAGITGSASNSNNQGIWWYDIGNTTWGRVSRSSSSGNLLIDPQFGSNTIIGGTTGGNVGIGTTTPSTALSFGGDAARTLGMERATGTTGTGFALTVQAGGSTSGSTDKNGGDLILSSGTATGTGSSNITFKTNPATSTGTTSTTASTAMTITGAGNVGIGTTSPAQILHLYSTSAGATSIRLDNASTGGRNFSINSVGSTNGLAPAGSFDIFDSTNGVVRLSIVSSGNIGIGTSSPATTALLDITSTTQGFLPPRMTTTQMNAIASPATGLTVFNTTDAAIEYYDGTAWWEAGGAAAAGTTGQVQFNTAGDFNADSNLFWDNTNKRLGIGTTAPLVNLSVFNNTTGSPSGQTVLQITAQNIAGIMGSGPSIDFLNATTSVTASRIRSYTFGSSNTGIAFDTGYGSPNTHMIIDNVGNVGIGTTSPSTALSFGGDVARTLGMERATGTTGTGFALTVQAGGSTSGSTNKNGGDLILSSGTATGTGSSNIYFNTNPATSTGTTSTTAATAMTITGAGNVGIGTTSPGSIFDITSNSTVADGVQITQAASAVAPQVVIRRAMGSINSPTTISGVRILGSLIFQGYDGTSYGQAAAISSISEGAFNISTHTSDLLFYTTLGTTQNERMRILANGSVGIGTASPGATLDVNGMVKVAGTGSETCSAASDIGKIRLNPSTGKLQVCRQ